MYRPEGDDVVQELFWDASTDSWHQGARFEGLELGSEFVTMETPLRPQSRPLPITQWFYGIGNDSQLREWHCENRCVNTTNSWKKGNTTSFPSLFDNSTLLLAGQPKQSSRLLYSRSANGTIFSMKDNRNVSQSSDLRSLTIPVLDSEMTGPAMRGSSIAVAPGLAANQLDMLVYQANGTDVTVIYPKAWNRGPVAIPVGRQ